MRRNRGSGIRALLFVGVFAVIAVMFLGLMWLTEMRDFDAAFRRSPSGQRP